MPGLVGSAGNALFRVPQAKSFALAGLSKLEDDISSMDPLCRLFLDLTSHNTTVDLTVKEMTKRVCLAAYGKH
jgi:hypothetical protein